MTLLARRTAAVFAVLATGACNPSLDGYAGSALSDAAITDAADAAVDAPPDAAPTVSTSCATLAKSSPDGYYTIDTDGAGPRAPIDVYCDMTTAGGGWTLVARSSAASAGAPFGWSIATGDVKKDDAAYSLDVVDSGLAFGEILIGQRNDTKGFSGSAYTIQVGATFLTDRRSSGATLTPVTVLGSCNPSGGLVMLRIVGYTARTDAYFFRDIDQAADSNGVPRGLFAEGFRLQYDDCASGGTLNNDPGILFVR